MARELTPTEQTIVEAQVARARAAVEVDRQRRAEQDAKQAGLEAAGFNFTDSPTFGS